MDILAHPNPALKQKGLLVDPRTDRELSRLVKQMAELMYAAPGVGLAATQIGVAKRVIVIDLDDTKQATALCNPVIVDRSAETVVDEEGCLSLPGIAVPVERSVAVVCEAVDLKGAKVRLEAEEMLARVLQHEVDHLDGILILDRATPEERKAAIRRYFEQEEQG